MTDAIQTLLLYSGPMLSGGPGFALSPPDPRACSGKALDALILPPEGAEGEASGCGSATSGSGGVGGRRAEGVESGAEGGESGAEGGRSPHSASDPLDALMASGIPEAGTEEEKWMRFLPIGLGTMQAMLKSRGYACSVANLSGLNGAWMGAYLRRKSPRIIGVSMFTFNRKRCFEILTLARQVCPEAILIAGGPHPTHLAQEVFQECPALDAIVKGEGELPLLEIVQRVESGRAWRDTPGLILRDRQNPTPKPIENLDEIGTAAEFFEADFQKDAGQMGYISTSRGCPARCTFCNTPEYWGNKVRFRSPSSVLREMQLLREKYGLIYYSFRDDTFTTRKDRTLEMMDLIQSSGIYPVWNCQSRVNLVDEERLIAMKRAGCEFIQFGVEHGSERILQLLDKGTRMEQVRASLGLVRKVGMNLGIYLITGIPEEKWDDVEKSAKIIRETKPHDVQISPLAIYPGTRLFDRYRKEGRISRDFFKATGDAEVFARLDHHTDKALHYLADVAYRTGRKAQYGKQEFAAQKKLLGFCAVTNILCGEAMEGHGLMDDARKEYLEIIKRESSNPWGFLKKAQLELSLGQKRQAKDDLREVERLAPGNPEAHRLRAQI